MDIFSLISSGVRGYSRPLSVGAMAAWIGVMGSTSTPAGSPPLLRAKSRIWSLYLRNGLLSGFGEERPEFQKLLT
jgi:hypothetical protein